MNKTRKVRKAPAESATSFPEGTMKAGWVIKKASNGVPRWMPVISAELNGFQLFTVDYAAKHIGKPIMLFTREHGGMWPKKNGWSKPENPTYQRMKFVPNGDALKGATRLEGWLKTQKPAVKRGSVFNIDGPLYECSKSKCDMHLVDGIQVDSIGGKLVSPNFMNTEVFVRT
jgi:hypothetical protein